MGDGRKSNQARSNPSVYDTGAYDYGTYVVAGIGNVAAGCSALSTAAKVYSLGSTAIEMVNSGVNVANGTAGIGDALAFAPAIGFGIGKLTGKVLGGACFFAIAVSRCEP